MDLLCQVDIEASRYLKGFNEGRRKKEDGRRVTSSFWQPIESRGLNPLLNQRFQQHLFGWGLNPHPNSSFFLLPSSFFLLGQFPGLRNLWGRFRWRFAPL